MSAAQSTTLQATHTADFTNGTLQYWTRFRVADLALTGVTNWNFAFFPVSEAISKRYSSKEAKAQVEQFCTNVADKLCELTPDHRTALDVCLNNSEFRTLASILKGALNPEIPPTKQVALSSIQRALEAHSRFDSGLIVFMKCCVAIELCHKAGAAAPITNQQLEDILAERQVSLDLSGAAITAAAQHNLNSPTGVPADVVTSSRQEQRETPPELVSNLPARFLRRLSELSSIFGHLEENANSESQSLGTFKLPGGCRSYFISPNHEQFALLDAAANDLEFKTQVLAFVGRMIKDGCEANEHGLTVTERREFDRLLIGFMHNFAVAHKKLGGSNEEIPQNFKNAVGYRNYWTGDTHYVERTRNNSTQKFPRGLGEQESDTSTTFPMCISLAIRLYENISGRSLSASHVEVLNPLSLDDSVLPPKLKERFDHLLAAPEVDKTAVNALRVPLQLETNIRDFL